MLLGYTVLKDQLSIENHSSLSADVLRSALVEHILIFCSFCLRLSVFLSVWLAGGRTDPPHRHTVGPVCAVVQMFQICSEFQAAPSADLENQWSKLIRFEADLIRSG